MSSLAILTVPVLVLIVGSQLPPPVSTSAANCPAGTFLYPPSNQCFLLLVDKWRPYDEAKQACRDLDPRRQSYRLAHPYDPQGLRKYLTTRYSLTRFAWLGARGDGKAITWEDTGKAIASTNPLWEDGRPNSDLSSGWCLLLATAPDRWRNQPENVYYNQRCTSGELTLCEYII